jgi:hypothetical protein
MFVLSVMTAVMISAAVTAASMTAFAVLVIVVVALYIGIVSEVACKQSVHRIVAGTADTAVERNTCPGKSHLCATADAAANENLCTDRAKQTRKCAMSPTACIHNLGGYDFSVLDLIHFKFCCVTEVLKDLSVFVCYCNFHNFILLSVYIIFLISVWRSRLPLDIIVSHLSFAFIC